MSIRDVRRESLDDITPEEWDALSGKSDPVNQPAHYKKSGLEAIDIIKSAINGAIGVVRGHSIYLWGNCLKYMLRWPHKNRLEDLRKARVYLDWLITEETHGG